MVFIRLFEKSVKICLGTAGRNVTIVKILIGYPDHPSGVYQSVAGRYLKYIERLRAYGFDVKGFCLTLNPPAECLAFSRLDKLWRQGDRRLLAMYERMAVELESCDVLLNYTGINLHPRFVERLPVCTVFQCFDDPESSEHLSRPVAGAYDLALVGNIAELDTYRGWGVERVEWAPLGLWKDLYDPTLTEIDILEGSRDIDLLMLANRMSRYRRSRVNQLANAFPDGHFFGRGWSRGYLPVGDDVAYLQRAKVGPNLHNSTGPINLRTFYLPANGVLQICDNKGHLSKIFELDREVIGFDTVEECIEKCRYYLVHDRERREIAAAGWRRVFRDYNEEAVFARKVRAIENAMQADHYREIKCSVAQAQIEKTKILNKFHAVERFITVLWLWMTDRVRAPLRRIKKAAVGLRGRLCKDTLSIAGQECYGANFKKHRFVEDLKCTDGGQKKRIAFVTPEFPTEFATAGGLSTYLGRMSRTLVSLGHHVEVFTISQEVSEVVEFHGVRVQRVQAPAARWWEQLCALPGMLWPRLRLSRAFAVYREAVALAAALERRHEEMPFDLVQSSDYRLAGMCITARPHRTHVVRCSSTENVIDQVLSNRPGLDSHWNGWRERQWLQSVDFVYAPSRLLADYQQSHHGVPVGVVRPPFFFETETAERVACRLPKRYLFHFGNIGRVKGSDVVADALTLAWREEPDLTIVWAGKLPQGEDFTTKYPELASERDGCTWLGPLEKPELYGVLKKAIAVVAPSRCDNLPNNVLESLACGVPVIGSAGASIDELVTAGVNGALVPIDDSTAIARAMLQAWRGEPPFDGRPIPPLPEDLEPSRAAENLLEYVRLARSHSESRQAQKETVQAVPA